MMEDTDRRRPIAWLVQFLGGLLLVFGGLVWTSGGWGTVLILVGLVSVVASLRRVVFLDPLIGSLSSRHA